MRESEPPTGTMEPERFARLLAHLQYFPQEDPKQLLERLGTTLAQFSAASREVPVALAAAAARGDDSASAAFGAELARTQARLEAERPKVQDLGPLSGQSGASVAGPELAAPELAAPKLAAPEPSATEIGAPSVSFAASNAPTPVLPSYLKATSGPMAPAPVTGPVGTGDDTLDPASLLLAQPVLPFTPAAPGASRPAPVISPPSEQSGETVGLTGLTGAAPTPTEQASLDRWNVERYAAFLVDRRTQPAAWIRQTYGVHSEREAIALLVHFNKRFAAEPGLREQWERLMAERAALTGRRP